MKNITPTTLEADLKEATHALLRMAHESAWNTLSDHCVYIVSEIRNEGDFSVERQNRNAENKHKDPQPLSAVMPELLGRFSNLYDINLYIHQAKRDSTIIDIRYFPKSSLEPEYQLKEKDRAPMLHAKVGIPPWHFDKSQQFDINWELQPWRIRWHMFWARLRLRLRPNR